MGIEREIDTCGIFPRIDHNPDGAGSLEEAAEMSAWIESAGNYRPVEENAKDVEAELSKERKKWFLQWSKIKNKLEKGRAS